MNRAVREDLEREVGHDDGVRDAENVVGVGRAVEGEDADLRVVSRASAASGDETLVGRDAIDAFIVDAALNVVAKQREDRQQTGEELGERVVEARAPARARPSSARARRRGRARRSWSSASSS